MAELEGLDIGGGSGSGLLGMISTLERMKSSEIEQENSQLRGMILARELAGPGPEEKFALERGKEEERVRHEQAKFAVTTFSELSKDASPANKAVMVEHLRSFYPSLGPGEQAAVKMVYDHSPMNPIEQKRDWWDKTHKPPQVTADPSKDPYAYGAQLFNVDDYYQMEHNYVSGVPVQRRRMIGVGEGIFAVRDDKDKVSILRSEDMKLEDVSERFKTTPGAILANGGLVYGENRRVVVGGVESDARTVYDAVHDKQIGVEVNPTSGSLASLSKEQQDLQDLLVSWAGKDIGGKTQGSRVYTAAQKMLGEGATMDEALEFVKSVYPGWNFRLESAGKTRRVFRYLPWVDAYAEGDKERIIAWPGVAIELKAKDGSKKAYHDARSGKVYGGSGKKISDNLDELRGDFATKTIAEIDKEMAGK